MRTSESQGPLAGLFGRAAIAVSLVGILVVVTIPGSLRAYADPSSGKGTTLRLMRQDSGPVALLTINHGVEDLFVAGKIKNRSEKKIVAYRVGWVVAYRSGKSSVMQGAVMNVPAGIAPQEIVSVPSQAIGGEYLKKDVQTIDFYVSEVRFEGGGTWKEDLRR